MTPEEARALLGVEADVSPKQLKRAYLRAVKLHKPDSDPEGFQRVRSAFETLESAARFRVQFEPPPSAAPTAEPPAFTPEGDEASPVDAEGDFGAGDTSEDADLSDGFGDVKAYDEFGAPYADVKFVEGPHGELIDERDLPLEPFYDELDALYQKEPSHFDILDVCRRAVAACPDSPGAYRLLIEELHVGSRTKEAEDVARAALDRGFEQFAPDLAHAAPHRLTPEEVRRWSEERSPLSPLDLALVANALELDEADALMQRVDFTHLPTWMCVDAVLRLIIAGRFDSAQQLGRTFFDQGGATRGRLADTQTCAFELASVLALRDDFRPLFQLLARSIQGHFDAIGLARIEEYTSRYPHDGREAARLLAVRAPTLNAIFGPILNGIDAQNAATPSGGSFLGGQGWLLVVLAAFWLLRFGARGCNDDHHTGRPVIAPAEYRHILEDSADADANPNAGLDHFAQRVCDRAPGSCAAAWSAVEHMQAGDCETARLRWEMATHHSTSPGHVSPTSVLRRIGLGRIRDHCVGYSDGAAPPEHTPDAGPEIIIGGPGVRSRGP